MSILHSGGLFTGMISSGYVSTTYFPKPTEPMNRDDFLFLLDLLTDRLEQRLITDLKNNPADKLTRSALADYLEEKGRTPSAQQVRNGYTPGGQNIVRTLASGSI